MPNLRPGGVLDARLETLPEAERRADLGGRLAATVQHAFANAPRVRRTLEAAGLGPASIRGLDDLARHPGDAQGRPPRASRPRSRPSAASPASRWSASPACSCRPAPSTTRRAQGDDFWRFRHGLAAAGFRRGDVALVSASYHLTPLGFMLDDGGPGPRLRDHPGRRRPDRAPDQGRLLPEGAPGTSGRRASSSPCSRRRRRPARRSPSRSPSSSPRCSPSRSAPSSRAIGVRVLQGYGTADLGCLAYECVEKGGLAPPPRVHRGGARPGDPGAGGARAARRGGGDDLRRRLPAPALRHRRHRHPRARRPRAAAGGPPRSSRGCSVAWATP